MGMVAIEGSPKNLIKGVITFNRFCIRNRFTKDKIFANKAMMCFHLASKFRSYIAFVFGAPLSDSKYFPCFILGS